MADHQLSLAVNGREHQLLQRLVAFPLTGNADADMHANGNAHSASHARVAAGRGG
jgi:hypothetical protein